MTDTQTSEWIEWAGNRRPVHRDELVNVRFRGGEPVKMALTAGDLDWVTRGNSGDIIAYRVVKP